MHNEHDQKDSTLLKRVLDAGAKPIPKQYFSAKNIVLWILAVLSVLVGGLAVSSIIFRTVNIPGVFPGAGAPLPLPLFAHLLPFVWILLLILFSYLAIREIRATKRGYRYEYSVLLLSLLLTSCVLGIGFYATGVGARLDMLAVRHTPFMADIREAQAVRWLRPENGLLMGVVSRKTDNGFTVTDPKNVVWTVTTTPDATVETFDEDELVGMRGTTTDAELHTFEACDVRTLEFSGDKRPPFPRFQESIKERKAPPMRSTKCGDVRPH
jgi:hypothetical protein